MLCQIMMLLWFNPQANMISVSELLFNTVAKQTHTFLWYKLKEETKQRKIHTLTKSTCLAEMLVIISHA